MDVNLTYKVRIWKTYIYKGKKVTAAECVSPLGKRVYDLRHACVSTWLNGGIAPAQIAEWAGHSVAILLKIYAKCIDGQDDLAKRRIEEALGDPGKDAGQLSDPADTAEDDGGDAGS
jgi:hypothetical protein